MKNNNLSLVIYEQRNLALTTNAQSSDKNTSKSSNGNSLTILSTRLFTKTPIILNNSSKLTTLDEENSLAKEIGKVVDETSHKTNDDITHETEGIVQSTKEIIEESKRKRGRPRKNTTIGDTSNDLVKEVPKRKPGRPRKTTPIVDPSKDIVEDLPKRKVGRPRKTTPILDPSKDIVEEVPKRKVGRPRKSTISLSSNLLSSKDKDISNISDETCFKNLQLLIQRIELQKSLDNSSNKYLVPNLTTQQKILIVILKKVLADANTAKDWRGIKELWSYISSTLAKEIISVEEVSIPTNTYYTNNSETFRDSENTNQSELKDNIDKPVSEVNPREILMEKVGDTYVMVGSPKSSGLVLYKPILKHEYFPLYLHIVTYIAPSNPLSLAIFVGFILLDSEGKEIKFEAFNPDTNFILLNHNGEEIKAHEVIGVEVARCKGVDYDRIIATAKVNKGKFNWSDYTTGNKHQIISSDIIFDELKIFANHYKSLHEDKPYFELLIKIHHTVGHYRTLLKSQRTTYLINDLLIIYELICDLLTVKDIGEVGVTTSGDDFEDILDDRGNRERVLSAGQIHFLYKVSETPKTTRYQKVDKESPKLDKETSKLDMVLFSEPGRKFRYKGVVLPIHMDLTLWPNISFNYNHTKAKGFIKEEGRDLEYTYLIDIKERENSVRVDKLGRSVLTIHDYMMDKNDLSIFKREIINEYDLDCQIRETFYYENGNQVAQTTNPEKVRYLTPRLKETTMNTKIMTLDIETRLIDGKMVPICMSFYDGNKAWTYVFINPQKWFDDMGKALKSIMKIKYNSYNIYIHNFGGFDSVFMVDVLSKLGKLSPTIRDNKLIKAKFTFDTINAKGKTKTRNKTKATLHFYDSYLILSSSLKDLSKSFQVDQGKIDFPLLFLNDPEMKLKYKGEVPGYKYFPKAYTTDFTLEDYNTYKSKYQTWNLTQELSKYCERDCIALHQIMVKFNKEIFDTFNVDICKYATAPSLAYAIYRTSFLGDNAKIPIILGKKYRDITNAYYGGITDYYKPTTGTAYAFDANSLYPHCMEKFAMPVGRPVYFKGDPYKVTREPFGFFKVKVDSPDRKIPILPYRSLDKKNRGTVYASGDWKGWYFSEEIKNAEKYGYKFEMIEGVLFEKGYIFKDFITTLYEMRLKSKRGDPRNQMAKMLMNSTYGRFGMSPIFERHEIVTPLESESLLEREGNGNVIPLPGSGNVLVSIKEDETEDLNISDVSVGISAAISSYGRIYMSHYLIKYQDHIVCVDTDGFKATCKIDQKEVNDTVLGMMKYEYTFKTMVSPGAKMYGGILDFPYKGVNEIVKIKGVKNPISYIKLFSLLYKNNPIKVMQEVWRRDMIQSTILVKEQCYTIATNENKRALIYDSNGKLIDTKALQIISGVVQRKKHPHVYFLPIPNYWETVAIKWGGNTLYYPYCKSLALFMV